MTFLTKDAILKADDVRFEDVHVPEWGGTIRLRTLTGRQAAALIDMTPEQRSRIMPQLITLAAINEDGSPLFDHGDVEALQSRSMMPLMRLMKIINTMNGFGDDKEALKNASGEPGRVEPPSASQLH